MINRPEAADLLAEARQLLKTAILPELAGTHRYEALMIANALSIAQREIEASGVTPSPATSALKAFLQAKGLGDDAGNEAGGAESALALAIAEGRIDSADPELEALLRELTAARLRISNPGYLGD